MVLADGMGGYNAGEVAAELAIKTVTKLVREGVEREPRGSVDSESGLLRQSIIKQVHQAAAAVGPVKVQRSVGYADR